MDDLKRQQIYKWRNGANYHSRIYLKMIKTSRLMTCANRTLRLKLLQDAMIRKSVSESSKI